jgi:hypothetical protein
MPVSTPEPGLVIHYGYLWRREHEAGLDSAPYARPCAVVVAVSESEGHLTVVLAPITHSSPRDATEAVEIPPRVKAHLGLDDQRSWIVTDDLNVCRWPSPDAHPIPHGPKAGAGDYGTLPPKLFELVKAKIVAHPVAPTPRTG